MAQNRLYGGREGPNAKYITLRSIDGHEFVIKRELACKASKTINSFMGGIHIKENEKIVFDVNAPSLVLQVVCNYMNYKEYYSGSKMIVPAFEMRPELVVEVLLAANFLDC